MLWYNRPIQYPNQYRNYAVKLVLHNKYHTYMVYSTDDYSSYEINRHYLFVWELDTRLVQQTNEMQHRVEMEYFRGNVIS